VHALSAICPVHSILSVCNGVAGMSCFTLPCFLVYSSIIIAHIFVYFVFLPRDAIRYTMSSDVSQSVCLPRSCLTSKRVNISSVFSRFCSRIVPVFPTRYIWRNSDGVRLNWVSKNRNFRPISRFISETIQDGAILIAESQYASYAIYHLEPFTMTLSGRISRSWYSSSDNCKVLRDRAIFTTAD